MLQQNPEEFDLPVTVGRRPLSQVLAELAAEQRGAVSIGRIREALADRSFATFLVFTASLNLLPIPPGTSLIIGIPIVLVAFQMVMGYPTIWLPQFFLRRSLSEKTFKKMSTWLIPFLKRMESLVKPRHWPFDTIKSGERIVGLITLIFGIAVVIPIPFSNWIPALAVFICGIALSERDGFWLGVGIVTGIFAFVVFALVALLAGTLAHTWLHW